MGIEIETLSGVIPEADPMIGSVTVREEREALGVRTLFIKSLSSTTSFDLDDEPQEVVSIERPATRDELQIVESQLTDQLSEESSQLDSFAARGNYIRSSSVALLGMLGTGATEIFGFAFGAKVVPMTAVSLIAGNVYTRIASRRLERTRALSLKGIESAVSRTRHDRSLIRQAIAAAEAD